MVNVLLALPLSQKFVDRLEAVAPSVHVIHATPLLRQLIRGDLPEDPVTVRQAEDQAAAVLPQCEVLVGLARFPARALQWAPNLRWIAATSAGVDKLAPEVAERVVLTNGTGLGAEPIAEHVICSLMMLSRGSHVYLRQQVEHKWQRGYQAREISGLTMGVIGMGAIGRAVARRARALGMRVIGVRRSVDGLQQDPDADEMCPPSNLEHVLSNSDAVVLATPLTSETRQLIGAPQLSAMKRGAILINIARGAVVDDGALLDALNNGHLGGAALDVFAPEPLPADSALWDAPNVIITPHCASSTDRYDERVSELMSDNLRRYVNGEPLRNVVDFNRGY